MEFKREKTLNNVRVIGRVESIERRDTETRTGVPAVAGHIMVRHGESVVKVEYYEMKTWSTGANPKYATINTMNEGTLVSLSASLEENKFVAKDGNLIQNQRLNLNFINDVRQSDEEGTFFDIIGVVLEPLKEVKDDEGNTINHTIKLGQAPSWQPKDAPAKGYSIISLDVNPSNSAVVNGIEKAYTVGKTVRVAGHAQVIVESKKEIIEADFGEDEVRITQKFDSKFYIDKGLRTLPTEEYTDAEIAHLQAATIAENERLKEEAANKAQESPSTATSDGATGLENLLGL